MGAEEKGEVFMGVDAGGLIQSWIWVYRASRRSGHRHSDLLLARATREHDEISPKKI